MRRGQLQRKSRVLITALALLVFSSCNLSAQATEAPPAISPPDDWRFLVTPYLFLPLRTQGTSTVAGTAVDVDLNLSKTLELLNVAFSARLEAWKGRFGLVADFYYVHLRLDKGAIVKPPRNPQLDIDIDIGVEVDTRQGWINALAGYRIFEGSLEKSGRRYFFDAGAGLRWNRLKQEVKARAGINVGLGSEIRNRLGGEQSWWEPTLAARGAIEINDCLTFAARSEVGGFGAGGNDLQWNLLAGFDWRVWDTTSLRFGYLYYSIDYSDRLSDGRFAYDITQHGPYIAVTWRW
ncbi:hypothetical protein MO867_06100 [Microbulbifer sp. OS29]|uniref:DUF481 domain-containing protein n=1 Tax=Microbulbifer okhotskensis TaxID=2926617 RepID=A0A9X2ELN0_9GAMM|nr:hypothetical protein [Microbulbifer okhotskensis]MCO1333909.1 hypothetical protein [Microbulbifer okhotskensis]